MLYKQVAQLWQRDAQRVDDFKEFGHFEAKFWVEGLGPYVSCQYLWTVTWGNGYTTLLGEVFTQRNFVADFIRLKLNFVETKPKNRL